ncbi:acyltransferase [Brucella oryzae]|uniref:acyltransferase family protein n=1 Tax=Brucella oryzae TaxID=335286 RepID=UPI001B81B53C|nr:acyltransferase [Brucella oryzae]MBR7654808.1 acyltransferase [Brucella oryzae]
MNKTNKIPTSDHRSNSFDLFRLLAASMVVIGHSYALLGNAPPLLFGIPVHVMGVFSFFSLSRYLITQSTMRDAHPIRFFARRLARIIPALWVCILFSIVFGAFLSRLSMREYFDNPSTITYLQNLILRIQFFLPGTFEDSEVTSAFNGSLWSISAEFLMYCVALSVALASRFRVTALVFIFAVATIIRLTTADFVFYNISFYQLYSAGIYFVFGMCVALMPPSSVDRKYELSALLLFACLMLSSSETFQHFGLPALYSFVVISICRTSSTSSKAIASNFGDTSYGIYLYSFPVQQALIFNAGIKAPLILILITFAIVLPLAYASWRVVEKPCLDVVKSTLKKRTIGVIG